MSRLQLSVAGPAGVADVLVEAGGGSTVAALTDLLGRLLGVAPSGLWLDHTLLPPQLDLDLTSICDGVTVSLTGPRTPALSSAGPHVAVVGGADAGTVVPLQRPVVVGRTGDLALTDPEVSRRHLVLVPGPQGAELTDLGSTNGTRLDGELVDGPALLAPGSVARAGGALLGVVDLGSADLEVVREPDLTRSVVRPPRLGAPLPDGHVRLPAPPRPREPRPFPLLLLVVPLLLSGGLALVLGPRYLLLGLLGPVLLLSTWASDRSAGRRTTRRESQQHERELAEARAELERLLLLEQRERRAAAPDPATVLLTVLGPHRRLWERRPEDPDALVVRVGTADMAARVVLQAAAGEPAPDPPRVPDVPVELPLAELGVVGLAGPLRHAQARWWLGQLTALHSPRDLELVVLTDRAAEAEWSWVRWLPHLRTGEGGLRIGNDPATIAARLSELRTVVEQRAGSPGPFPAVVVVLDGVQRVPGLAPVLDAGPAVGVHAVCLQESLRLLPEQCRATVLPAVGAPGEDGGPRPAGVVDVCRDGRPAQRGVRVDAVSVAWAERLARGLAPLRDPRREEADEGLPAGVRLAELLAADAGSVRDRWRARPRSATALLGVGPGGPVELRLDLLPHGLVAGTTGAGKSELLQTLVASLALGNRPDELALLLVDFKGGSAFAECSRLPHVVGLLTDLDGALVERTLVSLEAEFDRRQRLLLQAAEEAGVASVPDLAAHQALRDAGRVSAPLPRLVVVVDEFAALVTEHPGAVARLVDLAARGRSVGMHLVLATQSPSGVVSPKILANLQFRVALRVADAAESTAVLEDPAAARVPRSRPGRGFLRLGPGQLVPFQSARVGGPRPGAAPTPEGPWAALHDWRDLGQPPPSRPVTPGAHDGTTDLADLVAAVRAVADDLGVPAPAPVSLPPLPETLLLDDVLPGDVLLPDGARGDALADALPYGLRDLPRQQRQEPLLLDLARGGPLLVVGAAGSGRTQVLRTLAAAAARRPVDDLHLYALDCGGGGLLPLAALPHCGAVVQRTEPERAARLLARLRTEVGRRQALLAAGGHASVTEQRAAAGPGARLPRLLLLLDRWEAFVPALGERDGGALLDAVLELLREGAAAGVHVVLTGDRALALGRVAATSEDRLALRLADRADVALLGLDPRALPLRVPDGRGLRAGSEAVQVALLAPDPSGRAQADALAALAAAATARERTAPSRHRPWRVEALPATVRRSELPAPDSSGAPSCAGVLVGVGGDEAAPVRVDLSTGPPCFLVAGPPRSGRSTALLALGLGLQEQGSAVVVLAPRASPLRDLPGAHAVLTGPDPAPEELAAALRSAGRGPCALLVDDGELLRDAAARELLRGLVRGDPGGDPGGALVVLGGSSDTLCSGLSGWQVDARRAGRGLLLAPRAVPEGDLVGLRLPRSACGGPVVPGRGLLHAGDGVSVPVQVALP